MKIRILSILSWLFLIATVVLVLWYIFGNSPTEVFVYSVVSGFVLMKIWNSNNKIADFNKKLAVSDIRMKHGFEMVKKDMDLIKRRLEI